MKLVAARLAIPLARVIECGDSAADESLLRTAGVAIAIGDAPPSLRAVARLIVSQDRLAETLRRATGLLN